MSTVNNQRFVSAEVIAYELGQVWKSKNWDIGNIRTWCAAVETRYIKDIMTMMDYEEIDLTVNLDSSGEPIVLLPCNVFSVLDVYKDEHSMLDYKTNGSYLFDFKHHGRKEKLREGEAIFINYKGTNIDPETGELLIVKGHEEACKTFCKIQMFKEDAGLGAFDRNMWLLWKQEFSGQFQASKYNYQHKNRLQINNLNKIRGNMIVKIGGLSLHHELFKTY